MCGITGVYNYKTNQLISQETLNSMTLSLSHRGPDEAKTYSDNFISFGFTRLSIIDLETGSQPMFSNSGRYILIFNGEIYNFLSLKKKLLSEGYKFKSSSDSEVILALYDLGYKNPETELEGMFAFAIFDNFEKKLILSRDRIGKKPLFFSETKYGVVFASEIKSILKSGLLEKKINLSSISNFLSLGYSPSDESNFRNIRQLKPGTRLEIKNSILEKQWWKLPSYPESNKLYDLRKSINEVKDIFQKAVKKRLYSDVPMGIYLSGGIDSSLILSAIAKEGFPENFKSYSLGFEEKDFDESKDAESFASFFNLDHENILMTSEDFRRIFKDVVYKSDNLLANPASFGNYLLSEKASKNVKSIFHGGGGDELFFGYQTYRADYFSKFIPKIPTFFQKKMINLASFLPETDRRIGFKYKLVKFIESVNFSAEERHYLWRTIFTEKEKKSLMILDKDLENSFGTYQEAYEIYEGSDHFEKFSFADFKIWWTGMGLYQGDSMSMANSVELRMPFMDHDLIEKVSLIPRKYKFKGYQLKSFLKKFAFDFIPQELMKKPKKGFHIPLSIWFRGDLKDFVFYNLSKERIDNLHFLNFKYIEKVLNDHVSMKFDNSFKIINLLVLVEWYHRFILNES